MTPLSLLCRMTSVLLHERICAAVANTKYINPSDQHAQHKTLLNSWCTETLAASVERVDEEMLT